VIVRWLAVGLTDLWLWLAVTVPPLGPHPTLLLVLLFAHVAVGLDVVRSTTGFAVRTRRSLGPGAGRYRKQNPPRGYSGYRGD
jgi:hypothetical protein